MTKKTGGFTLVEVLVGTAVFVMLTILVVQIVLTSLRSSARSNFQITIRQNLDFAIGVMERQIRNAQEITACTAPTALEYVDQYGNESTFSCIFGVESGYVASGSARLTGSDVVINACTFTCNGAPGEYTSVDISLSAHPDKTTTPESTVNTSIQLRSY